MFAFDRDIFFKDFELRTGLTPKPPVKAGLTVLLDDVENDEGFTQIRDVAYVLATIRWETGQAFQPVKEKRASRDKNPWQNNYQTAGEHLAGTSFKLASGSLALKADTLVKQPELVLEPPIAYAIAARGMREGWFTGKKLSDFIRDGKPPDYVNARKIINGLDQAQAVAAYASAFELVLRAARGS